MPIKTRSRKNKGKKLQNYVRDVFRKYILERYPNFLPEEIESRPMSQAGTDIVLSPGVREILPLSVECKKQRKFPSFGDFQQSKDNTIKGTIPALVWQPHGRGEKDTFIAFQLEDFIKMWSDNI